MAGKDGLTATYDVSTLNTQLDRAKSRKRLVIIGALALIVIWAGIFLDLFLPRLLAHQLTVVPLAGLVVVLGFTALFLLTLIPGLRSTRSGGAKVHVDGTELRIELRSGQALSLRWDDPRACLELYDFSAAPRSRVNVDTSFSVRLSDVETALPREAFEAILSSARDHHFAIRIVRGSGWIYPASVAPQIYYIKSG